MSLIKHGERGTRYRVRTFAEVAGLPMRFSDVVRAIPIIRYISSSRLSTRSFECFVYR